MPRGVEYRLSLADAQEAHKAHVAGWSLRAISRMRYREWGYASPNSALEAMRGVFRLLELPTRDRVEAVVDFSTVHGNSARAFRDPAHPEHARHLAHRRHVRAQAREKAAS